METIYKVPVTPDYVCVFVCAHASVFMFTCGLTDESISIEVYTTWMSFE